jgi:hypothetical protein
VIHDESFRSFLTTPLFLRPLVQRLLPPSRSLLREGRREAKVKAKIKARGWRVEVKAQVEVEAKVKGLASESYAEALRLRSGQALLILDG